MSTSISTELGLLTTKSLNSEELGKQFFSMLLEKAPEVSPQKYDHGEPVSIPFEPEHMDGALDLWRDAKLNRCFLWTRARPRVIGSYWPAHRLHPADSVRISVEGKRIEVEQLTSLLQACAAAYEPVIGYVH